MPFASPLWPIEFWRFGFGACFFSGSFATGGAFTVVVFFVDGRAVATAEFFAAVATKPVSEAVDVLDDRPPRATALIVRCDPTAPRVTLTGTTLGVVRAGADDDIATVFGKLTSVWRESVSGASASRPATLTPASAPAGIHARFIAVSPSSTLHLPGTDPSLGLLPISACEPRTLRVGVPRKWESAWPSNSGSRSSS